MITPQPWQSRMATMPGVIVDTLSRQKKTVQGYEEPPPPLQVRPKHVPGGYVLQHMVRGEKREQERSQQLNPHMTNINVFK